MNLVDDTWRQRCKDRYRNRRLHSAVRIAAYCEAYADAHGHKPLTTGELQHVLGLSQQQVSRAIATARGNGSLHEMSTARCLVMPDASDEARCPATHRGRR